MVPQFFAEQLSKVDAICATKALGALRNSPHVFLRHDLNLQPPEVRLTAKILNTVAIVASKPPSHPLYYFYIHARKTKQAAHKGPLHAYFQSSYADVFQRFANIQQPDSTQPLPQTPNFHTLIIQDKERAIQAIKVLKTGPSHVIVYSDGSRFDKKATAAAAWCENTKHYSTHQLGREDEYGIFKAEYVGLALALQLGKHSITRTTRQITIVLDNQGVVKDMSHKKTTSQALSHKIKAVHIINDIYSLAPGVKITLRWCPGHEGITGNEEADRLATTTAKNPLPQSNHEKPTFASFRAAIKAWAEKESINSYTLQDHKRLGHQPHPKEHIKALDNLKNKHSVSTITQLCTGHVISLP